MEEERIHLVCADKLNIEKLPSKIPDNAGRYHLFNFKHTHEGDYMENIGKCTFNLYFPFLIFSIFYNIKFVVFIYSMPGYNCSIKERMLYSSCKYPFTDIINNLGVKIIKKVIIYYLLFITNFKFIY